MAYALQLGSCSAAPLLCGGKAVQGASPVNLVKKKTIFGKASHEESDPVSSPVDVLDLVSQCRFLKE